VSYSLTLTEAPQYLHATYSGDIDFGDSEAIWSEIIDYLAVDPHLRLLVEGQPSTPDSVSVLEAYEIGMMIAKAPIKAVRIAFLCPSEVSKRTLRLLHFTEDVAVNRGAFLRICLSRDEAEQWLR
jgi:hypothetical protein